MSSSALQQKSRDIQFTHINGSTDGNRSDHNIVSLFPLDRKALEALLRDAEEELAPLTQDGKINICGRSLDNADLRGLNLSAFDVTGCSFTGTLLDREALSTLIPAAKDKHISLRHINFTGATLEAKYVSRPDIGLSSYVSIDLRGLDMQGADFSSANLKRIIFVGTDLTGANFSGANLSLASAKGANFQYANFSNATLSGGDFRDSDFRGATFTGAVI